MKRKVIVVVDNGSSDVDDDFLTLMALDAHKREIIHLEALLTTHFFADLRAKALDRLCEAFGVSVPIFSDSHTLQYKELPSLCQKEARRRFYDENPLWPDTANGLPKGVALPDQPIWCPNFLQGYIKNEKATEKVKEKEDALQALRRLLTASQKEDQVLDVFWAAPVVMLTRVPLHLWKHMRLTMVGAGFDSGRMGYHWGLAPRDTQKMLDMVFASGSLINLISSGFIRAVDAQVPPSIMESWFSAPKSKQFRTSATALILQEWQNCMGLRKQHTYLCSALAFQLWLEPNHGFPTQLVQASIDMRLADELTDYLHMVRKKGPLHLDVVMSEESANAKLVMPPSPPDNLHKTWPMIANFFQRLETLLFLETKEKEKEKEQNDSDKKKVVVLALSEKADAVLMVKSALPESELNFSIKETWSEATKRVVFEHTAHVVQILPCILHRLPDSLVTVAIVKTTAPLTANAKWIPITKLEQNSRAFDYMSDFRCSDLVKRFASLS